LAPVIIGVAVVGGDVGMAVGVVAGVGMVVAVGTSEVVGERVTARDCCQGKPFIPKKISTPTNNSPPIEMIHKSKMFPTRFPGGGGGTSGIL